jgi:NADPH:quinone reductase-like Zn-dependent oxidoreductase
MKAIQIEAFGNPAEVVKVVDIPDVGAPAAGEVVIALEASPINPSGGGLRFGQGYSG